MTDATGRASVQEAAAERLLSRPLPSGYREEWARHYAETGTRATYVDEADAERAARNRLVFRIADEWLALPAALVDEVTDPRICHSLPHRRSAYVLGIVNVRGELLVSLSLAALLGIAGSEQARDARGGSVARLVVIVGANGRVALPVDEVHGLHLFAASEVGAVPATIARSTSAFTSSVLAWRGHAVGGLDAAHLLAAIDRAIA
ncbi:chemotaxis protein CheW [Ancylobacter sp. A5.8]|uniref:chemotaxis protein CheW n=1 Tax=Ancylobacter gelatini TaxID=2919920 RepID=UPI001F4DA844|nr:chemotaxis protein CheW [Ancylobacter gelatini]MCJ8141848.1 chemotaxis protein CheW [Ancylobacter gelatini]